MCVTEILHVRNNFIGCVENLKSMCRGYTTRFACNAPAFTGHPRLRRARHCTPLSQHGLAFSQPSEGFVRYKQRGSWTAAFFATKACDFSRGQL